MRVHHCISGNVLSVPLPLAPGHIHSPSRPWNEWDDAATPCTEKPVRFIPFVGSPSYTTRAECRAKSLRFPA